jgi:RNA polymerase sigma-70 factor (ECF subfamily)
MEQEQEELVFRAKQGDQSAFMKLYELYYREMYAYAVYMLRHPQDAEDAVSETVTAAFEGIGKLRDVSRFRQWLFKILSNQCKKKRKSYADRNKHFSQQSQAQEREADMFCVSDRRDLAQEATDRQWVQEAFDTLSDQERYIVNSFLFGGYRGEEIAQSLGIGASTLRSKYRRALQKMRKKLEEGGSV